jgi:putative acyl-CoA dehydrogenase
MGTVERHHPAHATHEVINQSVPLEPINHYETDLPMREAVAREGGGWAEDRLQALGALAGSPEAREHCERAERNVPELRTHDRYGNRIDEVRLDPSWHWLLGNAIEHQCHSLPWRDPQPGSHVARVASFALWANGNGGVMCPVSMTHAVVPPLREHAPEIYAEWEERLTVPDYAAGAIAGMLMTEKQGGSDVRANTTVAEPVGGDEYELTGHKWFCSYPPCDAFLTLAQAPGGLSCFFFERGEGFELIRLKEKLGTRSLPSAEGEFRAVRARLVGEEGRGVATIIGMVNHTRLDCMIGSRAAMRRGLVEAAHHTRHRAAFGKLLIDQPAMRNVLADLALECEAATAAVFRVARAFDEDDAQMRRLSTAVMKYWICKRAPGHAAETLECLGGNGYVEESGMPLIYRDAPVNTIWEGSGNVAALDVLRAIGNDPQSIGVFLDECKLAAGENRHLDEHFAGLERRFGEMQAGLGDDPEFAELQFAARRIVEDLALGFQGSLLVRHAPPAVADAFCASRLGGEAGHAYGTLPRGTDVDAILDRVLPA